MAIHDIAIDLGSSFTTIFKRGSGVVLREPSMVCLHTGRQNRVKEIGIKAKKMQGRTGESAVIVYPITEGIVKNVELASTMLRDFLGKVIPKGILKPRVRAVVGIPCGLSDGELADFEKTIYQAGISSVKFVPSVIASAIGDKVKINQARGSVIVNIGGGTTEVAVVSLNNIISGCSINVGGKLMDNAILEYIAENYNINISEATAEKIKQDVGSLYENDKSNVEFSGTDVSSNRPVSEVIQSTDIRVAIVTFYQKIVETIRAVMNSCKPDIMADITETGVVVSGGASGITGLENYFRKALKIPVITSENGENSVITGLGILLNDEVYLREIISEN